MSLLQKTLDYLIQPIAKENQRLFQILTGLNDQEVRLVDQANQNELIVRNFEYRFELPGVRATGTNTYQVWKQVRFPLDEAGNTIGTGQQITRVDINTKVAPTNDYSVDLLISKDKGTTFNSNLPPAAAQKLILPAGLFWISYGGKVFSNDILQEGWWFRVDETVGAGTAPSGVEIVIRGKLIL